MTQKSNEDLSKHKEKPYMTMEITEQVMEQARETLIKARMSLLFKHPFFGQLALRLTLTPASRQWCPTAATDGKKFYYNPAFILELDDKENVFLVAHELGHCIYEHFMRREGRDPKLWNIAGDYIINNTLETDVVQKGDYARVITYVKPFLIRNMPAGALKRFMMTCSSNNRMAASPKKMVTWSTFILTWTVAVEAEKKVTVSKYLDKVLAVPAVMTVMVMVLLDAPILSVKKKRSSWATR